MTAGRRTELGGAMTRKEMNLRVFRGEPIPHVFFQPRFEPWVAWHKLFNSLPASIRDLSLREIYDLVGASMRSISYYTGQADPIEGRYTGGSTPLTTGGSAPRTNKWKALHGAEIASVQDLLAPVNALFYKD